MDNRFELIKPLGEGGQGRVYLVRDRSRQNRLVALKRVARDEERRRELAAEFGRLAGLRHPSLARAFDFSEDDEGPFFTCEFVDGPDIVTWARQADEEAVFRAMASVLRALALLHDRDIVHGDVSPANVLVAPDDHNGTHTPKLLDLGGARKPGQPGTATTAGFAAPEVLTGRGLLTSCDLYSFGVLLAVTLYNSNPFGNGDPSSIVQRQLAGEMTLPETAASPVAKLCRSLLNPDPASRPRSAQETLERLAETAGLDLAVNIEQLRGGDLPAPRMVGRRAELASLTTLIDRLDDARSHRTARITGPVGSGRSAALAEVVRTAQLAGFDVIGHAGGPISTQEMISGLVSAAGLENVATSTRRALAPWIGELTPGNGTETSHSWSQSVGFAAVDALAVASRNRPVLVALDDLTDCDQLVRDVAVTLARALAPNRSVRPPAILVVAGDPAGLDGAWPDPGGIHAELGPLDASSIEELVSTMLPGVSPPQDLARTVYLTSKGWPGSAEQLVRQAVGPGQGGDLETRTNEIVLSLDRKAQELLAVMSLTDAPCLPGSLADVGGTPALLESLCEDGFLFEVNGPDGPGLRVASQVGEAAAEEVPKDRLKLLAAELARIFEQRDRLVQAGHLWERAEDKAAAAGAFATLAGKLRRSGDLAGAGQWYEIALELAPSGESVGRLAQEAVATWRAIGRFDLALAGLQRVEMDRGERSLLEAELTLDQGRHREALDLAHRIADRPTENAARVGVIAAAELQLGMHEQALATSKKALENNAEKKPGAATARLAQIGALACTYLGRVEEATILYERAEQAFEAIGDLTGRIKVSANRGMLQRRRGDLSGARELYDRAVDLARQTGDRAREGLHLMNRATVATVSGDAATAYEDYLAALDIAVVLGNDFAETQVEINLADLLSTLGDQEASISMTGRAIERCRALGQERLEVRATLTSGVAMIRAGALKRAERRVNEARRRFAAAGDDVFQITADLHLAELRLRQGDPAAALSISDRAATAAEEHGLGRDRARALVLVARAMAEQERDFEGALARLDEAERLFEETSLPDELWRLRFHRARILRLCGRAGEAEKALRAARVLFDEVMSRIPPGYRESYCSWGEAAELAPKETPRISTIEPNRRNRDLERLMEINRELTREHDPKRLLSLIMEHAVELTGAERGMVVMPRGGKLEPVISHQISEETDVNFSRSVTEKVVQDGRAVLAIDALGDDRFRAFVSVHTQKLRSILAVPLQIRRKIVGVVYLDSRLRTGLFSEDDRHLLEAFGAQAAIALETARLISENAKRCEDLQGANQEIRSLSDKLEEKLVRNEAKLRRVGALLQKTQTDEAERLKESGIIGRATAMQQVMRMIDRIALTDVPVYVFGASGTGKELVARAIHAASERAEHPFVPVNCGALPSKLLASELFGHTRGAFTGAVSDRPGLFRLADRGTLFLDEVVDMDAEMQAHLLRVLQDGTFRSLGNNEEISVDVRILAASNRDLDEEVREGRFREDLYYRLNVVRIDVPPLTERREDIPLLAEFFIRRHGGEDAPSFSREAMDLLVSAEWPGNVRELENEVLRAMTMATPGEPIKPDDLSPRLTAGHERTPESWSGGGTLKERVDGFERIVIQRVLTECGGNATRAAKQLGISRAGLYKKLDKHQLSR